MADEIRATPRSPILGLFSDLVNLPLQYMSSPERTQQSQGVAQFLYGTGIPKTLERASYGESLFSGAGMTLRPKEETINAAMNVAPFAPAVGRLASRAIKATEGMPVGMSIKDVGKSAITREGNPIQGSVVLVGDKIFMGRTHGDALNRAVYEGAVRKEGGKYIYPKGAEVNSDLFMTKDGQIIDRLQASKMFDIGASETAIEKGLMQNNPPKSMTVDSYIEQATALKKQREQSPYPQQAALDLAQQRAALPVEQGGLGLPANNTPEMRAQAMNAIDYLHGTDRLDRLLSGKNFDPKKATSGAMPYGTNTPSMASSYAMNKADTSLALNDFGNLADYFQVLPKSMGERGKAPINVENIWYRLPQEKKAEILDKASRIGYEIPEEAGGGFVLHKTSEGMPYSKSHWEYVLNRESGGNPLTALRKTFAESGMLDAYAPSELADIYKLAGFPYEITQTNAPWTSAKGVFTGKAMISNPINTSDTTTLQETVIPFLKEQFKNDRTRVKTGGVDQWDKNTRFTPKQWVNQLEEDLAKGDNSFVWTSIPDKVTAQLEKLGFNGIIDTGGKMGGEAHQVVIPFKPEQIRSRFAAFDPFRKDVATATAMGVALPDLLAAEPTPKEKRRQSAGLLSP
jgi:hypothetical protein